MPMLTSTTLQVRSESDLVPARHLARSFAKEVGLGLVDETKLVTAVSELTRNILVHGGGGSISVETVEAERGLGVRCYFDDEGPGIENISQAMVDGFSTTSSLGYGLPGAKRLVDEFEIRSQPGKGTHVTITKWSNHPKTSSIY